MMKTFETEGARYDILSKWDSERKAVKVNLKIDARDWKKPTDLEARIFENNHVLTLTVSKILGTEEEWQGENGTEVDYSSVHLHLTARSENGEELYQQQIDASGRFDHDITFYIKPEDEKPFPLDSSNITGGSIVFQ